MVAKFTVRLLLKFTMAFKNVEFNAKFDSVRNVVGNSCENVIKKP
jgi:hypothetical protein